jgi:hypothetical protein
MPRLTRELVRPAVALAIVVACGGSERAPVLGAPVATTAPTQPEVVAVDTHAEDVDAATAVHAHARCVLAVDLAGSRAHPLARAASSTLARMPPFDALGSSFDALLDADWFVYAGPRFFPNRDSAFIFRYSGADSEVDDAFRGILERAPVEQEPHAAPRGIVDHFPRALLRPQPGIAAMVPPGLEPRATQALAHGTIVPPVHAGEAVRVSMRRPGGVSTLVPDSVYEARAWAVLRDDGGADLFAELDCPFDSEAVVVANELRRTLARYATGVARAMVHGLLDGVEVKPDGRMVKLHVTATAQQAEALLGVLDARVRMRAPP